MEMRGGPRRLLRIDTAEGAGHIDDQEIGKKKNRQTNIISHDPSQCIDPASGERTELSLRDALDIVVVMTAAKMCGYRWQSGENGQYGEAQLDVHLVVLVFVESS